MKLTDYITLVTAMVAVSGLFAGLYQYIIAQKWKRSEFAAKHLEQLTTDPKLELFCKLLDWSVRLSSVPDKYRSLTDDDTFVHDWRILKEALLPDKKVGHVTWQHMLYRDLIDHCFGYCERINHYISIKLISIHDVSSLLYWLQQISKPRFMPEPEKYQWLFIDYLQRYEYRGVIELIQRFNIKTPI
jgi:hypothetical protein